MSPSSLSGTATARRRSVGFLAGLFLGLAVGGAGAAYWFNAAIGDQQFAEQRSLQHTLLRTQEELVSIRAQSDALGGRLAVEESTRRGLETSLQTAQAEIARVREQLAFFEQLLPPGPKGAISVRALDIERIGPNLLYRVLLQRSAQDEALFKGVLQFVARGIRDGKEVKINLEAARSSGGPESVTSDTNGFTLAFEQFQRGAGLLTLPENFEPKSVTVNILEGNAVRASRTIQLPARD
jgi:hypothetical protein